MARGLIRSGALRYDSPKTSSLLVPQLISPVLFFDGRSRLVFKVRLAGEEYSLFNLYFMVKHINIGHFHMGVIVVVNDKLHGSLFSCWENMVRLVVGRTLFFVSH